MPPDKDSGDAVSRGTVTGTLTYRERIMLPPDSVAKVWLLDTSRADAPATELAHQIIENPGAPPIAFVLEYDKSAVDQRLSYGVRAEIRRGDRLLFTSDTHYPVLTQGAGETVDLLLVAPSSAASKPDASLTNTYWKLTSIAEEPYQHVTDNREPHLKFLTNESQVSGFSGCNRFSASFDAKDGKLDVGNIAITQMACAQGMETERDFLQGLNAADRYRIQGDTLQLSKGDTVTLRFEAVYF